MHAMRDAAIVYVRAAERFYYATKSRLILMLMSYASFDRCRLFAATRCHVILFRALRERRLILLAQRYAAPDAAIAA